MKRKIVSLWLIVCMISVLMTALPISASAELSVSDVYANIKSARCYYNNNQVTAQVTFDYIGKAGMLYVAVYNESQLVALQGKTVKFHEYTNTVEITNVDENYKNYKVKVFYWAGNSLLVPAAQPVETEIIPKPADYGFILSAGMNIYAENSECYVRLLNQNGNIIAYPLAEKVNTNIDCTGSVTSGDSASKCNTYEVYSAILSKALSSYENANYSTVYNWFAAERTDSNIQNYANRIITYQTNKKGEITELIFASSGTTGKENYLTYDGNVNRGVAFDAETKSFAGIASVDENTVVFNLPIGSASIKGFSVGTTDSFTQTEKYDVAFLSLDENNLSKVMVVTESESLMKYGYLIDTSTPEYVDELGKLVIKIFADNRIINFEGAEIISINGIAYRYEQVPDILSVTNALTNYDSSAQNASRAQLIKYTINSECKIDNILTMQTSGDPSKTLVLSKPYQEDVKYTSTNRQLGTGITLSTSTKVMFIPEDRYDTDEYSVGTYSKLKNNSSYNFEAYDCSETNVPAIIVVYGSPATIGLNDVLVTFALVDSIKDTLQDGEVITTLTCKVDGNDKTYYAKDTTILAGYNKGDVLKVEFDTKGYIRRVAPAFDVDNIPAEGVNARYEMKADSSNSYRTIYGTVYARDDERMVITPYDVAFDGSLPNKNPAYMVPISTNTKIFVLNTMLSESSPNRLTAGTIDSIAGYVSTGAGASKVFAYIRNNSTKFILVVKE